MTTRLAFALLLALCLHHAAQAVPAYKFDVATKAEAIALARANGVGFNPDGTERTASLLQMFSDWCAEYGLASPGDQQALRNFKANMREVRRINLDATIPFWAAGNAFSHLSREQFAQQYLGSKAPEEDIIQGERRMALTHKSSAPAHRKLMGKPSASKSPVIKPSPSPAPTPTPSAPLPAPNASVNWVTRGMVTPIRNQGGCGSCWAFAATALVESMYLMSGQGNVSTLNLSEQQVVSCVTSATSPYPSFGCNGGYLNYAIDYYSTSPVMVDSLWPYTATNGTCANTNMATAGTSGNAVQTSYRSASVYPSQSEQALVNAVLQAPVGFLMMVDDAFQNYRGGIYSSTTCTNSVNHAMLLVGVDFDAATNQWYWLVKNSWDTWWGEAGYIRVKMTGSNGPGMCGMYQWAYTVPAAFTTVLQA